MSDSADYSHAFDNLLKPDTQTMSSWRKPDPSAFRGMYGPIGVISDLTYNRDHPVPVTQKPQGNDKWTY